MAKNYGKNEMVMATGAGVGMVQAYLTRDVLDAMWGPIPYISDYLGTWGTYSTFGNIAIGAVTLGLSTFTKVIKNKTAETFLQGYGLTTLLGGIFNGVFPNLQLAANLRPRLSTHNVISNPNYVDIFSNSVMRMDTAPWTQYANKNMPNSGEAPILT
jgi:hypothetical protein